MYKKINIEQYKTKYSYKAHPTVRYLTEDRNETLPAFQKRSTSPLDTLGEGPALLETPKTSTDPYPELLNSKITAGIAGNETLPTLPETK